MDRAQAILNSRRAQILFDALLVQKDTNVTITDMWGRIVMGPEICDSYLELMSWWGVRFGFGYGDLGVGGPSRGVGHRMEKERDFRVVALNQLLGCCTGPPIAAVFHAFFLPAYIANPAAWRNVPWTAGRSPQAARSGSMETTWPPGPPNAWALGCRRLKSSERGMVRDGTMGSNPDMVSNNL
jgi:hypothetical protein